MERRHLAAASGHLHLVAAAAYYMAKAAGRAPDPSGSSIVDVGGGDATDAAVSPISVVDVGGDDDSISVDVGGDATDAAASPISVVDMGGDDDSISIDVGSDDGGGEELEWTTQNLYDLLLLLASFLPPAPAYKALPRDVVEGLAWTWIVLFYGVFLTVAVTVFSVRAFGTSTRCLPTFLRVLLLTTTIVVEVLAAVYMMPATTLTMVGACFSVVLLLAAHLYVCCRRRR